MYLRARAHNPGSKGHTLRGGEGGDPPYTSQHKLTLSSAHTVSLATDVQLGSHALRDAQHHGVTHPRLCAVFVKTPHAPTAADRLGSIADNATGLLVGAAVHPDVAVKAVAKVFLFDSHGACSFVLVLIVGDVNRSHTYNVTC